jgi:hypothetical protein
LDILIMTKRKKTIDPTPLDIEGTITLPDGRTVIVRAKIDITSPITYDDGRPVKKADLQRTLDRLSAGGKVSRDRLVLENIAVKRNTEGGYTLGRPAAAKARRDKNQPAVDWAVAESKRTGETRPHVLARAAIHEGMAGNIKSAPESWNAEKRLAPRIKKALAATN